MKEDFYIIMMIGSSMIAGALIFYLIQTFTENSIKPVSKNLYINNCSNLSFYESVNCLNDYVNSIFKYNMSNNGKLLSIEQLKNEGGTCLEWTNYYLDNMKNKGFLSKEVSFYNHNNSAGHSIALVYDLNLTKYCILDQRSIIGCGNLGNVNETI